MSKYYKVTMIIALNEDTAHPRKWVPDAITECLESGEDLLEYKFEECTESAADTI